MCYNRQIILTSYPQETDSKNESHFVNKSKM